MFTTYCPVPSEKRFQYASHVAIRSCRDPRIGREGDGVDLSPHVSCVPEHFSRSHPAPGTYTHDQPIGSNQIFVSTNLAVSHECRREIFTIHRGSGNGRERTATDDDNDNDITIACVLHWFRSYTEDQGTHTHVCRPGRQVEEGGRDREEEVECGSGGRGAHALVHRPRTQSRYQTLTHVCALSLPFSLIRAHNVSYYAHAIARAESGERRRARLRTCMCRMLEPGVRARTLRHAVSLARECSRLPRYIAPRHAARCAYVREHV